MINQECCPPTGVVGISGTSVVWYVQRSRMVVDRNDFVATVLHIHDVVHGIAAVRAAFETACCFRSELDESHCPAGEQRMYLRHKQQRQDCTNR